MDTSAQTSRWQDLGSGITCIDAEYVSPGSACFYLLERDGEFAVIETGTYRSLELLRQCLQDKGIADAQLRYVIPTHVHLDHAGGAGTLMAHFDKAQLLVHPRGAPHLVDPSRLVASSVQVYGEQAFAEMYGEITPVPQGRVREIEDGATIALGDSMLEFRHLRGHADHHFCIWDALSQGWFTGDMFGSGYPALRFSAGDFVIPATTPTQFDPALFLSSVDVLAAYQPQRMYLTHFGELTYSSQVKGLLCRQIERYRDLALQHAGDLEGMLAAVEACTRDALASLDPPGGAEAFMDSVSMDVQLNVQGLAVWAARQAA